MKAKTWNLLVLGCTSGMLAVLAGVTIFVDPFLHYHGGQDFLEYPLKDERYQNDGIVRHYDYDSIITGTSMSQNFNCSEFDELWEAKSIKIAKPVSYIGSGTACSPKNASLLRMMLTNVVWGEHGTGKLLRNDKVRIAGKTGTCYIIENRGYNTSKKRLAFCGFFPADNPKYSCIVLTCHPRQNAFGAASTSGTVLKNIALKMYSRGMLDNNPELRPDPEQPQQPPVMFASTHQRVDYLRQSFNIGHVKHFAPAKASRTVPSLKGCSLRDAINHMESLGIDVTFSGSGYVTSQSIPPGTTPAAGARIHLTLNN
ncbi:penicillin-binding transpeptidase domain-containing protein [uncultured Muribaculum sp.]|uniref:PASTA domain-containing protein n=1 Tax=uncultured Muribaculum sp. TaxID=1918613 RepID=UPI00266F2477|nr:penicillin-binding transpeptidase domain-containing protein [uncultured Muribaculum sp.]